MNLLELEILQVSFIRSQKFPELENNIRTKQQQTIQQPQVIRKQNSNHTMYLKEKNWDEYILRMLGRRSIK